MSDTFRDFEEFWPHYVLEHSKPTTRWFHFVGTAAAMVCVAGFVRTRRPWLLPAALVAGYGPAWVSHFFIEKNKPASFQHPLWSFRGDLRMFSLMLRGAMTAEVARVRAAADARAADADASAAADGPVASNAAAMN